MTTKHHQALLRIASTENSRAMADAAAEILVQGHEQFAAGIDLLRNAEPPVPQRIAWAFEKAVAQRPELMYPYTEDIVAWLPTMQHPAERRNFAKIMAHIPLPRKHLGELFEIAFEWLLSPQQPIAVRVWCMDICGRVAEKEPDLKREVVLAIEEGFAHGSAGYKSHGKKWVRRLNK